MKMVVVFAGRSICERVKDKSNSEKVATSGTISTLYLRLII